MKTLKIRLEKFLKMYFYFSPSERKGIILLAIILLFVMVLPSIYRALKPNSNLKISISQLVNLDSLNNKSKFDTEETNTSLFNFNPNTASESELKNLGFTDKNIKTITNYLSKGGSIKSVEGLKKIYGINEQLIEKLTPYIQFENTEKNKTFINHKDSFNTHKNKTFAPLELNTADSVSLVKLYKIGPALAHKILEYRNKLGGFLNLNQLTEIFGFDEDILFDLQGKIYVDDNKVNRINLNTVNEGELKMHPYFKYKVARVIVNYRNQHGKYKSFNELLNIKIINDSILNRIKIYGIIE